jgi:hypothetical protein
MRVLDPGTWHVWCINKCVADQPCLAGQRGFVIRTPRLRQPAINSHPSMCLGPVDCIRRAGWHERRGLGGYRVCFVPQIPVLGLEML